MKAESLVAIDRAMIMRTVLDQCTDKHDKFQTPFQLIIVIYHNYIPSTHACEF